MRTKYKILLIFSEFNKPGFPFDTNNIEYIVTNNQKNLEFVCLIDPTRENLESILQKEDFLCVMPFTQYTIKKETGTKYEIHNYLVSQLLENLKIGFIGCSYMTHLILNDNSICSEMSFETNEPMLVTRYNYKHNMARYVELENFFPITLEPIYFDNYLAKCFDKSFSVSQLIKKIDKLFNNDVNVDEIYLHKNIEYNDEIIISIIGNPPYSIDILTKYNKHSFEGKIIEHKEGYAELISNAYKLYNEYKIKDFGQFKYVYNLNEKKYNLIGIDCTNGINDKMIYAFQQYFKVDLFQILCMILISYLIRNNLEHNLINEVSIFIPKNITNKLIPFSIKKKINFNYSYEDICDELKWRFLQDDEKNRDNIINYLEKMFESVPPVKNSYDAFVGGNRSDYSFLDMYEDVPKSPQDAQEILNVSIQILNGQLRWHSPGMLYNINPPVMLNTVAATTLTKLYNPNAISSKTSAGFLKMEKQIIRQLSTLIGWDTEKSSGIFTAGGKYCLIYAIKCGLNRCIPNGYKKPVVITSDINHFSIESVCNYLGISGQCRRVPVNSEGTIDFVKFETILYDCFKNEIPIACIIFSGGNTTHCNVEDIKRGYEIIHKLVNQFSLNYIPYIYYDLVVGWPWLFFKDYDFNSNIIKIDEKAMYKIKHTLDKIQNADLADGVGIDFHKGGFSPYTNSIFLSKNATELYSISSKKINISPKAPHQYSMGNSRGTSDILVTWNILQSVGVQGFQSFIANMITVANTFAGLLSNLGFEILQRDYTYGFATILWTSHPSLKMNYSRFCLTDKEKKAENAKYLFELSEYWISNKNANYYTRFLPNYKTIPDNKEMAIISLLPMTLNLDKIRASKIANDLYVLKQQFDDKYLSNDKSNYGPMPEIVEK